MNPVGWIFNLIVGTLLYHAAWFCWRGPPQQLRRLVSSERMPHTMLTGVSLLAATYMWNDNKKVRSARATRAPPGCAVGAIAPSLALPSQGSVKDSTCIGRTLQPFLSLHQVGSWLFGGCLLASFLLDLCSSIPGGKHIYRVLMKAREMSLSRESCLPLKGAPPSPPVISDLAHQTASTPRVLRKGEKEPYLVEREYTN
jgi:hypothetical protein